MHSIKRSKFITRVRMRTTRALLKSKLEVGPEKEISPFQIFPFYIADRFQWTEHKIVPHMHIKPSQYTTLSHFCFTKKVATGTRVKSSGSADSNGSGTCSTSSDTDYWNVIFNGSFVRTEASIQHQQD